MELDSDKAKRKRRFKLKNQRDKKKQFGRVKAERQQRKTQRPKITWDEWDDANEDWDEIDEFD